MADITIRVCDICGDRESVVERVTLTRSRKQRSLDLCETHLGELERFWTSGTEPAPAKKRRAPTDGRRRPQGGQRLKVTSLEEIEAKK